MQCAGSIPFVNNRLRALFGSWSVTSILTPSAGSTKARGPGLWQADVGLSKEISATERVHIDLRAEAFNIFNRAQFGCPQSDFSAVSFGAIRPQSILVQ